MDFNTEVRTTKRFNDFWSDFDETIVWNLILFLKKDGIYVEWATYIDLDGELTTAAYVYRTTGNKFDENSFETEHKNYETAVYTAIIFAMNL